MAYQKSLMILPKEATEYFKRHCERKRIDVLSSLLEEGGKVLDVGCGIGTYTSFPLSFLPVDVTAIDSDPKTIEYAAKRNNRSNLRFLVSSGEDYHTHEKFDLIVCSHILEHLVNPEEILLNMNKLLKDDGILYVAIPNGFGSFEVQNSIPRMMVKTKWGKRLISRMMRVKDTLNVDSPHVRFFTLMSIFELLKKTGWYVENYFNDEFLGGIVFDRIFAKIPSLAKWNVEVADKLPAWITDGWIFICKKSY